MSTEEAQLYYEFVVRGTVEKATVSDKIESSGDNDVILAGNNEETQVVRGYTGNPGYRDAYHIDGDLIFFARTGGTSDFFVRLDGRRILRDELPRQADPTIPRRPTYIERDLDSTLGIQTPGQGELYYELIVQGGVDGAELSNTVSATLGTNDAVSTDNDTGATVIRGFTGNPGYGDAYEIDGELVAFRRDGGSADFVFLLNGRELTLAQLARTGTGYAAHPADEDPIAAYRSAVQALDQLADAPGEPTERLWYNRAMAQIRRARTAIKSLVEQGYRFQLQAGADLTIRLVEPDTTSSNTSPPNGLGFSVASTRDTLETLVVLTEVSVSALS
ncbi:hypothetical protein [Halobacterium sp. R2-5]|uniref:hypothetical protein n=1 Tax=Halobacterium sp. R2-5 TaxID=2715751 RepID=UPI00142005E8|nr:hypothetical protein [Halobacterium sp. R2-5]NIC00963.1 hypothetical protein [Halobacterium sp. R2-5]